MAANSRKDPIPMKISMPVQDALLSYGRTFGTMIIVAAIAVIIFSVLFGFASNL